MRAKRKPFTMILDPPPQGPELLSVKQMSHRLGCGEGVVYRRARAGIWPSTQVNGCLRFEASVVEEIFAKRIAIEAENNDD